MPFQGRWDEMPRDTEDLRDRLIEAFTEGVEQGRKSGANVLSSKVQDWLLNRYLNPDIARKTPKAQAMLEISKELVAALRGDLGQVHDPVEVRNKAREFERLLREVDDES
ncbi:hypothetical protein ACWIG4_30290 [Streptomyces sp. NPDC002248]